MSWDYSFTSTARKELKKLGHEPARKIIRFLDERVCETNNPRQHGKALKGSLDEYWRYRIENYRIPAAIVWLEDQVANADPAHTCALIFLPAASGSTAH